MKKSLTRILPGILLVSLLLASIFTCFSGCSGKSLLDPQNPVTLTIWHVYGEQADAPMNLLIEEFNDTVGREKGIQIKVTNVTGTSKILAQLTEAQAGKPGSPELPDLFSCHPQNAPSLGIDNLIDWSELFSKNELDGYVSEFLDSGIMEEKLVVFPVSKSTYALFLNGSQFKRFSADTGVSLSQLSDWNGFFDAAEKYYNWSDGHAFCALDYLIRHIEIDILSRTGKLEYTENGWYDENDPHVKESFSMFASALAKGHIVVSDLYANTQVMTGDVLSGIGSSAAVGYYNDTVTYPDNTSEPMELIVLPLPKSGGENEYIPQTGVGLSAFKTTDQKAEAAYEFAKWFTEGKRNLDFVVSTGYMPVTNGAFEEIEAYEFSDSGYESLYDAIKIMYDEYTPVVRPDFDGFYDKTNALYAEIREMQPALAERANNGESIDKLTEVLWDLFCGID